MKKLVVGAGVFVLGLFSLSAIASPLVSAEVETTPMALAPVIVTDYPAKVSTLAVDTNAAPKAEVHEVKPVDVAVIQKRITSTSKWRPHSPQATMAQTMALLDGVTTYVALENGGREANPLMPSSPAGILAVTLSKIALLEWADRKMEPDARDQAMAVASAVFGGAAVNNAVVAANKDGNDNAAIAAGVISGVGLYFLNRHISKNHALVMTGDGVKYVYQKRF